MELENQVKSEEKNEKLNEIEQNFQEVTKNFDSRIVEMEQQIVDLEKEFLLSLENQNQPNFLENPQSITYLQVLQKIHNIIEPEFYFEIGVKFGKSLRLSKCPSIGIDPKPRVKSEDFSDATIFNSTSDDFFGYPKCYKNFPQKFIDFAFVDGNHLFEYVLRDFINLEKYSHVDTIIAMDDVLPRSLIEAHRKCLQSSWTADSWKIVLCLRKYRPDLDVLVTNSSPTGLGLVSNLDSNSTVLSDNYDKILNEYLNLSFAKIIGCRDQIMSVVQPDSELLDNFISKRKKKLSTIETMTP